MKNFSITKKENKNKEKKNFLTSKKFNFIFIAVIFTMIILQLNCYAAGDVLATAKTILSKAAQTGGGLWAAWGLVSLGLAIKDHNGPGIQGGLMQILGGGIVILAGTVISGLDLTMTASACIF